MLRHAASLALALLALACLPVPPSAPEPPPGHESAIVESDASPPSDPFVPFVDPAPAYFAVSRTGVVRLSLAGEFALIHADPYIGKLVLGPANEIYLLDAGSLALLGPDEQFTELIQFLYPEIGAAIELAFADDGSIWVLGTDGVGHYNEGFWRSMTRTQIGATVDGLTNVAVDRNGRVWVASLKDLHYLEGELDGVQTWQSITTRWARSDELYGFNVLNAPNRDVLVQAIEYMGRFDAARGLVAIPFEPAKRDVLYSETSVSPRGQLVTASDSCDLIRVDPSGVEPIASTDGAGGWGCEGLQSLAIDAQARVWVGSLAGVHVLGPTGETRAYPSGSVPELVGRVTSIVVPGNGPDLPAPGPIARFDLAATVLLADKPLAKAPVEICPQLSFLGSSPCAHSIHRLTTTTDAKGKVLAKGLAIGNYGVAVQVQGTWVRSFQADFASELRAGQVHDLGPLEIE